jgi:hypothetical protein
VQVRFDGSFTSGEIERVRFIGPMEPATKRGRFGVRFVQSSAAAARDAGGGDVELVGQVLGAVVGLRDRLRVERVGLDDVGAGVEVLVVDAADDVRAREDEDVGVALEVVPVVPQPLAPVVRLAELVALDHGAHRAVEDEHALGKQLLEK